MNALATARNASHLTARETRAMMAARVEEEAAHRNRINQLPREHSPGVARGVSLASRLLNAAGECSPTLQGQREWDECMAISRAEANKAARLARG